MRQRMKRTTICSIFHTGMEIGMSRKNKRNRRNRRKDRMFISCMVVFLVGVMSIQIVNLHKKRADYQQREVSLREDLEDETQRQKDLKKYEDYTQTQQYIEEIAKRKLGLLYPNETIFREKD